MVLAYLSFLPPARFVSGESRQVTETPRPLPQKLGSADLLELLDCITRADQKLAVRPEFYGDHSFSLRYLYPVVAGRKANMLNMLAPSNWVTLVLYHPDTHHAALFEVGLMGRLPSGVFFFWTAQILKKAESSGR